MTKLPSTNRSLPIALIRARESIMSPIRDMLAKSDITEQQWRVLRALDEFGPQEASVLAHRAALLFPSLTRITQTLVKKNLVTRTQVKTDKRRQLIEITPAGSAIIAENLPQAGEIVARFKEILGEDRYELLLDLLADLDPNKPEES